MHDTSAFRLESHIIYCVVNKCDIQTRSGWRRVPAAPVKMGTVGRCDVRAGRPPCRSCCKIPEPYRSFADPVSPSATQFSLAASPGRAGPVTRVIHYLPSATCHVPCVLPGARLPWLALFCLLSHAYRCGLLRSALGQQDTVLDSDMSWSKQKPRASSRSPEVSLWEAARVESAAGGV